MKKISIFIIFILILNLLIYSEEKVHLKLSTTTNTDNSGLLKYLLPKFEEKYNLKVDVISVGTGKAFKIAENGDVAVVLVHARQLEDKFVADGFGVNRKDVMYNDFIILGPQNDPAGLKKLKLQVKHLKS